MGRRKKYRTGRRASTARSYRSRAVRRPAARRGSSIARTTRRNTRRNVGRGQVIRIELVQPQVGAVARPEMIGKQPIVGLTRNRSRF